MGRVRVIRNDLPRIIRRLPQAADEAVDDTAVALERSIEGSMWHDTGVALRTTRSKTQGRLMHSEVGVGVVNGPGFYVRYHEYGTTKLAARPVVRPAAHAHEPVLSANMQRKIREACR